MRRHAALYLLLGLVTALMIISLATGLQTRGSVDPKVWWLAHRHGPVLQMLDLAALFVFVVIGLYGLTVSRLQMQLQHQAEDFGDQMQTLLHRNDELVKVNEEYAEQIAALEAVRATPPALMAGDDSPALTMGDSQQRIIAALHWQVDAQAQQLEAVHRTLEHQHHALQELQQHVYTLEGNVSFALAEGQTATPRINEILLPTTAAPEEPEDTGAPADVHIGEYVNIVDFTVNDGSTLIGEMLDFDVSAFAAPASPAPEIPYPNPFAEARTYPVDDSYLAMAAGHISSIPEPTSAPAPEPEPERVEISVGKSPRTPMPPDPVPAEPDLAPVRTQGAIAFDKADSALSSLQSETQEALSSLRAEVEATIPPSVSSGPAHEPEQAAPPAAARRKPWHLRF